VPPIARTSSLPNVGSRQTGQSDPPAAPGALARSASQPGVGQMASTGLQSRSSQGSAPGSPARASPSVLSPRRSAAVIGPAQQAIHARQLLNQVNSLTADLTTRILANGPTLANPRSRSLRDEKVQTSDLKKQIVAAHDGQQIGGDEQSAMLSRLDGFSAALDFHQRIDALVQEIKPETHSQLSMQHKAFQLLEEMEGRTDQLRGGLEPLQKRLSNLMSSAQAGNLPSLGTLRRVPTAVMQHVLANLQPRPLAVFDAVFVHGVTHPEEILSVYNEAVQQAKVRAAALNKPSTPHVPACMDLDQTRAAALWVRDGMPTSPKETAEKLYAAGNSEQIAALKALPRKDPAVLQQAIECIPRLQEVYLQMNKSLDQKADPFLAIDAALQHDITHPDDLQVLISATQPRSTQPGD
jgi:hypothetical protein